MEYVFEHYYNDGYLIINYANQSDIDNFVYPIGVTELYISGDYIDSIKVPDGVERLVVGKTGLKQITLPTSLRAIYCNNNLLKHIVLPSNIEIVELKDNLLETVTFDDTPKNLETLKLSNNSRLKHLSFVFPECLELLKLKRCYGIEYVHPSVMKTNAWQHIDHMSAMCAKQKL